MASEIVERTRLHSSGSRAGLVGLVGIQRGGVPLAARLSQEIQKLEQRSVPTGELDIGLYRDDAAIALPDPKVGPNRVEFEVEGGDVVLVDDVLHTGRTVRAAIDCLFDYGRPHRIWLAVLCDRGGRQLPVAADFIGTTVDVPDGYMLDVVADGGSGDRALVRLRGASLVPPAPVKRGS